MIKLSKAQKEKYKNQGFLLIESHFSNSSIKKMTQEINNLPLRDDYSVVFEKDKKTVRSFHGCHKTNDVFSALTQHPSLINPITELLESELYLHQFKINIKAAFEGDLWPWHQDFAFWHYEDGMPRPEAISAVIFLNDVTLFNGPFYFIPGSHKEGLIDTHSSSLSSINSLNSNDSWLENFSTQPKHTLPEDVIRRLATAAGIVAPIAPKGSILFFDCNLAHASLPNISPFDRKVVIASYNSINNKPQKRDNPRPEVLASRDYRTIRPKNLGVF